MEALDDDRDVLPCPIESDGVVRDQDWLREHGFDDNVIEWNPSTGNTTCR